MSQQYEVMKAETAAEIGSSELFKDSIVEFSRLKQFVPTIKVKDDTGKALAAETRATIHTLKKSFEAMRKSAKGPYLEMGKVVDNIFKPFLDSCGSMLEHIDSEYVPYMVKQEERVAAAQREAMRQQIEAKNVEESKVKAEMMTPSNVTETDSGKTFLQDNLTVEVVNEVKLIKAVLDGRNTIPLDVIQINEVKLKQLCRGSMYSEKKWAKYGVKVVRTKKVQTRT